MDMDLSPIWISLKTASVSTVIVTFLGIFAARYVAFRCKHGKALIDGLLNLPLVLPPTVVGFFLLLIFGVRSPIGALLMQWNVKIVFSWGATVIAAATVSFPLMYKTVRTSFELIDTNLMRAGRTLGSSEWEIFFRIVLPLAWPGIIGGCVMSFARAIGEFGATLMIAGSIPGKTQTIPVAIYIAMQSNDMVRAYILVLIITAISLLATYGLNRWLIHKQKYR
ncbi:molybdate ABC transporter permease subunit [Ethanoligenens harbinense]|uniref:Molybdenum transport system permease n=1 Tax=Ethanoligenens harbinense (strain DSM 18485 / JCM 12961 / CGMCC 1.5033 / YUAN-3) TaxID=663278 RepID=E6U889_ETHHY|nr:molybdate ABC transporter permease subunit [Ethanoligenens harbinense]ADU27108.1 molybdate ABC transporter, inner membrane subunit [Ethanoligenens harbinense YUAN-3]AVQ96183.1 molybdate ABC transporter permease subunit [Ethanoligenens harbinense YUAN-3]AYF38843.1 molybdate ABC transporter permease subunit [Ethanoligenens harbinense]AYF41593.1 molybdate ABC transporter permease subunit [Ethanoligenens harbinense]QCN92424.1 molybdate ABC transporter permease subunit [Ethanoligenens harbinense